MIDLPPVVIIQQRANKNPAQIIQQVSLEQSDIRC